MCTHARVLRVKIPRSLTIIHEYSCLVPRQEPFPAQWMGSECYNECNSNLTRGWLVTNKNDKNDALGDIFSHRQIPFSTTRYQRGSHKSPNGNWLKNDIYLKLYLVVRLGKIQIAIIFLVLPSKKWE